MIKAQDLQDQHCILVEGAGPSDAEFSAQLRDFKSA
jgi:hypothetical protein